MVIRKKATAIHISNRRMTLRKLILNLESYKPNEKNINWFNKAKTIAYINK